MHHFSKTRPSVRILSILAGLTLISPVPLAMVAYAQGVVGNSNSVGTQNTQRAPTGPGQGTVTTPNGNTSPVGPAQGTVTSPAPPAPNAGGATSDCASGQNSNCLSNPLKYNSLNDLLTAVLSAAIQLGSVILTLALVWVGFKFVAARGNEEAIRKARTALMWTVIGGLILLGATAIQLVITSTVSSLTS